jgi:outer membrane protein TolC
LLQAKKYEANAAVKNIDVAKYSKLPTIDATYQAGFGTANNLTGIFYPYGVLPMTGPPSISNNYTPATGSAASLLLNWEAATFGQRDAKINIAVAEANAQQAAFQQSLFEHKIKVISAYLDLLLSYDVANIQQHNIERVQAELHQSSVLANTGIKPGVDTALFLSELSKAKTDFLSAGRQLQQYQLLFRQLIVTTALPVPADTAFLNGLPAGNLNNDTLFANAPVIRFSQGQLALSQSKETLLKKSYLPKLSVWGTGFARGSGFEANGTVKGWDGLALSRYNYGAGLQLSFPIMKYGEVKKQLQQQTLLSKAEQEKIDDARLALNTQQDIANMAFNSSVAIATEAQQELKSAQYAFGAMQIRYNTGLVNFADLIQAQFNLLKAELDLKKAHWDAWKALLLQAAVAGDENIFLQQIK